MASNVASLLQGQSSLSSSQPSLQLVPGLGGGRVRTRIKTLRLPPLVMHPGGKGCAISFPYLSASVASPGKYLWRANSILPSSQYLLNSLSAGDTPVTSPSPSLVWERKDAACFSSSSREGNRQNRWKEEGGNPGKQNCPSLPTSHPP